MNIVGIMNGTSLDGVDFVLCRVRGKKIEYVDMSSASFPAPLRKNLLRAAQGESKVAELSEAHFELGRFYARALAKVRGSRRWKFDLIGVHGQTVYHNSGKSTLQIGEPSFLSAAFAVPVVSDFRAADIAAGGKGAPLATFFHGEVGRGAVRTGAFAFHNIGGISNVSFFKGSKVLSFDTGPGNMLIDLFLQKKSKGKLGFDVDGRIGSSGVPDFKLIERWLKHSYFSVRPPKSCGREEFGEVFMRKVERDLKGFSKEDAVATLTEFTAMSIARSYQRFLPELPKKVFVCGGGAKNPHLMFRLRYQMPSVEVLTTEDAGWPVSAIEGGAFALMAYFRWVGKAAHMPASTGASRTVRLGKITQL